MPQVPLQSLAQKELKISAIFYSPKPGKPEKIFCWINPSQTLCDSNK
jgi:hypothetical protein